MVAHLGQHFLPRTAATFAAPLTTGAPSAYRLRADTSSQREPAPLRFTSGRLPFADRHTSPAAALAAETVRGRERRDSLFDAHAHSSRTLQTHQEPNACRGVRIHDPHRAATTFAITTAHCITVDLLHRC